MQDIISDYKDLPLVLNASDVARTLGISRAFAYNLFNANDFPVTTIGKRKFVKKDSFLKWLNNRENTEV